LQPLFAGDKVVVTIWYRAPELLMGARHYHWAVDTWAVGCVVAELASLRPIFKGEEVKMDGKKNVPFQRDQLIKVFEIVGTPDGASYPSTQGTTSFPRQRKTGLGSLICLSIRASRSWTGERTVTRLPGH